MLTFTKLGNYGRLGNQLFQYAFLRTHARRLNTSFWCPHWDGDDIFDLADQSERAAEPAPTLHFFDPGREAGYCAGALTIQDHTEIQGFFQSERYYASAQTVRAWYAFKPDIVHSAHQRHPSVEFDKAVSLSLRIDADYNNTREFFPLYPLAYYRKALALYPSVSKVIVFADRPDLAKDYFGDIACSHDLYFVENTPPAEQLYLMTACGLGNIITNSTFAWWGAFLNAHPEARICTPAEWTRPGVPQPITDITPHNWTQIASLHPVLDHFQFWRVRHPLSTLKRLYTKLLSAKR